MNDHFAYGALPTGVRDRRGSRTPPQDPGALQGAGSVTSGRRRPVEQMALRTPLRADHDGYDALCRYGVSPVNAWRAVYAG